MVDQGGKVKTARTTFRIIEAIEERDGATLAELTEELSLSRSSIHNYLHTLEAEEYLVKDGATYRVGLRFLGLGGRARNRGPLYRVAAGEVRRLAEETGQMANLVVEEHGWGYYLCRERGAQGVNSDPYVGDRVHLHNTAVGKAILAHLPRERVDEIVDQRGLPEFTENTITDRQELFDHLDGIRQDGVAYDDEEAMPGLRCVAVPIVTNDDEVAGAISINGPKGRFQGELYRSELPERIGEAVNVVEVDLEFV